MKDLVGIDIGGSHISSLLVSRGALGYEVLDGECSACLGAAIAGYPLTDKFAQS